MTEYEQSLLERIEQKFSCSEDHCEFDLPNDPSDLKQLLSALDFLESKGHIMIIASPKLTDDDFIEVEPFPPCCKPPIIRL